MATSSIIENIRVNNLRMLEEYVAAMEAAAKEPLQPRDKNQYSPMVTDSKQIHQLMQKALKKKGIEL